MSDITTPKPQKKSMAKHLMDAVILIGILLLLATLLLKMLSYSSSQEPNEIPNTAYTSSVTAYIPYEELEFYKSEISQMEQSSASKDFINTVDGVIKAGELSSSDYKEIRIMYYQIKEQSARNELLALTKKPV